MKLYECEQEVSRFTIVLTLNDTTDFVEIHESYMDGWILYECFFLPSFEVCYFGWDENVDSPEWISLGEEVKTEKVSVLCRELAKYKRPAA